MKKWLIVFSIIAVTIIGAFFISLNFLYPLKYVNLIKTEAENVGISPSVIASVINVESSYNAEAVSNKNAIGLMQLKIDTANYVCSLYNLASVDENDLKTPQVNIKLGCLYLKYLLDKFSDLNLSLCAYNAGETIVRNWLKNADYSTDGKTLNYIPYSETRNYIKKINKNIKYYNKKY